MRGALHISKGHWAITAPPSPWEQSWGHCDHNQLNSALMWMANVFLSTRGLKALDKMSVVVTAYNLSTQKT